jgi:predicted ATP-binding protein involved in virulence
MHRRDMTAEGEGSRTRAIGNVGCPLDSGSCVPSLFRIDSIHLENFRCFVDTTIELHPQLTVVYAENGGGKTALLQGLAVALGAAFTPAPRSIREPGDVREVPDRKTGTLVPQYPCRVVAQGIVDGESERWERAVVSPRGRTSIAGSADMRRRLRGVWAQSEADWPVIAFYGTQRLWSLASATERKRPKRQRRTDGYIDVLDPRSKESQLIEWLFQGSLAKLQGEDDPSFEAFLDALKRAVTHPFVNGVVRVRDVLFDVKRSEPVIVLSTGERVPWSRLSDGYHAFVGLVADLARRCVTLNPHLGEHAIRKAQGVVLIDEVDLYLHPRWQRVVLHRLCETFPKLQFVVSTHSPQVLSSADNDQVVGLVPGRVVQPVRVAGRDSNAILRDVFAAPDRDPAKPASQALAAFHAALDRKEYGPAAQHLTMLRTVWGDHDPEVVRAEHLLSWATDDEGGSGAADQ